MNLFIFYSILYKCILCKRFVFLVFFLNLFLFSYAQVKIGNNASDLNVGVLLELEKSGNKAALKIAEVSLTGSNDSLTVLLPGNKLKAKGYLVYNNNNHIGTNPIYEGLCVWLGDSWKNIQTNSIYHANDSLFQNIEVNMKEFDLHFKSNPLSGAAHFVVDDSTFVINTLTNVVGVNTLNPTEALEVNGTLKLKGTIKLNDNVGNDGQVLISKGSSSAPSWQTMNQFPVSRISSSTGYTITSDDFSIHLVSGYSGTLTLPVATSCSGKVISVANHSGAAVTISEPIRVASGITRTSVTSNSEVIIQSDGTEWFVIGNYNN